MHLFKGLLRVTVSSFFKLFLFLLAIAGTITLALGTPTKIKQTLADSKIYDNIVDSVIESTREATYDKETIPLDQPEIQQAIKKAFPPQFLQSTTEQFIDGTYHWLEGKTTEPDFRLDFTTAKDTLVTSLADYAATRVAGLPACTAEQLPAIGDSIDPFNEACVPPGTSVEQVRKEAVDQFNKNNAFLANPIVTAKTFSPCPKDETGKPIVESADCAPNVDNRTVFANTFAEAPRAYRAVKSAVYVLGIIAVLLAGALVLLHERKRAGLRSISYGLIGTGIFLALNLVILNFLFDKANAVDANEQAKELVVSGIKSVSKIVNKGFMIFIIAYVALGVAILLAAIFIGRHKKGNGKESIADGLDDNEAKLVELARENNAQHTKAPQPTPTSESATTAPVVPKSKPSKKTIGS